AMPFAVAAGGTTNPAVTIVPVPPFPTDVSGIYVANAGGGSIAVFAPGANGNVAPVRTVPGTATTGIIVPGDVALDSTGNLYVANNNGNNILVYPPGVSGSWPPARTISGASTGLSGGTRGIVLDSAGNLFVAIYTNSIV